jgi:hypothetical protein
MALRIFGVSNRASGMEYLVSVRRPASALARNVTYYGRFMCKIISGTLSTRRTIDEFEG